MSVGVFNLLAISYWRILNSQSHLNLWPEDFLHIWMHLRSQVFISYLQLCYLRHREEKHAAHTVKHVILYIPDRNPVGQTQPVSWPPPSPCPTQPTRRQSTLYGIAAVQCRQTCSLPARIEHQSNKREQQRKSIIMSKRAHTATSFSLLWSLQSKPSDHSVCERLIENCQNASGWGVDDWV